MSNVNKMNLRFSSNQKVIVEELIEHELEGIVGGVTSTLVSNVTAVSTDGNDVSINDVKIDIKNDSKNIKKIVTKVKKKLSIKEPCPLRFHDDSLETLTVHGVNKKYLT